MQKRTSRPALPIRAFSGSSTSPTGAGIWSHDAAHSSILIHGDYLYLNTGTGVDNTHRRIRTPDAPSLVVLDKRTGRLVARDDEHIAPNIFHSTWSSPSLADGEWPPAGLLQRRQWDRVCVRDGAKWGNGESE